MGVNTLVPTLFVSGHSTLDVRACLTERRNVAGEGKQGGVRAGRSSEQEEAGESAEHGPQVGDLVCRNPPRCPLKGGSRGGVRGPGNLI